jgi:hypothetical protein
VAVVVADKIAERCKQATQKPQQRIGLGDAPAIEAWRATLPEGRRKRLIHPLSNVRAWRAATEGLVTKRPESGRKATTTEYPGDLARDALAAWREFRRCLEALEPEQAAAVWRTVQVEIVALRGAKR